MRTGKLEEDTFRGFLYAVEVGAHALALAIALAGYLFFVGEDAGRTAHIDEEVAAFDALYRARDDFPLPCSVFGHNGRLLGFADLLDDDLFCRLRGDTAIVALALERKDDLRVELRVLFYLLRILDHDVMLGVVVDALVIRVALLLVFFHLLAFLFGNDACVVNDDLYLVEDGRAR